MVAWSKYLHLVNILKSLFEALNLDHFVTGKVVPESGILDEQILQTRTHFESLSFF